MSHLATGHALEHGWPHTHTVPQKNPCATKSSSQIPPGVGKTAATKAAEALYLTGGVHAGVLRDEAVLVQHGVVRYLGPCQCVSVRRGGRLRAVLREAHSRGGFVNL